MTLLMIYALSCAGIIIELILYYQFKSVRKMIEKTLWMGLLISLAISWALGHIFGASGVIVMSAALLSTCFTCLWYTAEKHVVVPNKPKVSSLTSTILDACILDKNSLLCF